MAAHAPRDARAIEDIINALARRQHGVVTRAQLRAAGLGDGVVRHRLETGRFLRLHQGVYRAGPLPVAWEREIAAVLACGAGAVLSHSCALRLLLAEAETADAVRGSLQARSVQRGVVESPCDSPTHVTVGPGGRGVRRGICVHRARRLPPDECTERYGIPVTTPLRTLLDVAALYGANELERTTARLFRAGLIEPSDLERRLAQCRSRPGVPALRVILGRSGGPSLTRSEAEASALALIRTAGLPAPQTNVGMGPYELDFFWPRERLSVEVDGFRHHSSRSRFEGDRRKDAWLRARGITVLRFTWRQLTEEAVATAVQLGQALVHASR